MKPKKNWIPWALAAVVTVVLAAYLGQRLTGEDRTVFVPGAMTHGHHQIELACDACHTPFNGVKQEACVECHGARLAASNDSHPRKKFEDPRNADRLEVLEARRCVTCHLEHRPQKTRAMGVTLPDDYCFHCHQEVGEDRPSHQDLAFDSCAAAGCHNYHDNTALYEDFLAKHVNEPALLPRASVPLRDLLARMRASGIEIKAPLARGQHDAPAGIKANEAILQEWAGTAHARGGINCTDCHQPKPADGAVAAWTDKPGHAACGRCHKAEVKGFLDSRHGMRLKQNLPPLTPAMARHPMQADARDRELGCASCHGAHGFDTRRAAVEACLGCHDDKHSRAFRESPHFLAGKADKPTMTCATCHLPREIHRQDGTDVVRVQHNQNWNLRPNEKMARGVCMNCHGLGFTLDALADPALITNNFRGQPARHVESVEWASQRVTQPSIKGDTP
jgi:hypothetical protein